MRENGLSFALSFFLPSALNPSLMVLLSVPFDSRCLWLTVRVDENEFCTQNA